MRVDTLLTGSRVLLPAGPAPGPLALADGVIAAIGPDCAEARPDEVVRVDGGLIVAGFQDAHVHPIAGGLQALGCDLSSARSRDDALLIIRQAALEDEPWLIGGGWAYDWFDRGCPDVELLDALTGSKPAYLEVRDGHSAWVNSAALQRAGIGRTTPDPVDGRIERRDDGEPQGTLHEGAMALVERVLPEPTPATLEAALAEGQRRLFACGVTSWQDAWVAPEHHRVYREAASDGRLIANVRGALWWDRERGLEQLDELKARSEEGVGIYQPETVKLMLDGVIENFTADMIDPYVGPGTFEPGHTGLTFVEPAVLGEAVTKLRAAGLQCHFHAIGDGAVRSALDAIELASRRTGLTEHRDHVSHIQVVHPDDQVRFGRLGAIANCQTLWACRDASMEDLTVPFLGPERAGWQYPFRSIADAGGRLAMGSDWPVSSPNVMDQIHVATTRTEPDGSGHPLLPEQALSLSDAFAAWTTGSAYVNYLDSRRGTIAVGNVADLAVLDADPFVPGVSPADIGVELTLVGGEVVFQKGSGTGE